MRHSELAFILRFIVIVAPDLPVLVDTDGIVVAGPEALPDLLPWLDLARDDVVPRQRRWTRKRCHLIKVKKDNYV